MFQYKS